MTERLNQPINVYRVDGEPVSGWRRRGGHWSSFSIGEDGEETERVNWGDDETAARGFAKAVAYRSAGRRGRVTLNEED